MEEKNSYKVISDLMLKSIENNEENIVNEKCNELAEIICDFRNGEITKIDAAHVRRWISQFEDSYKIPILEEMIYVFTEWYLKRDYILDEFIDKIPGILQKKYNYSSEIETCRHVSFVDIQNEGQSQKRLLSELKRLKQEQYGVSLISGIDSSITHYAYIDDGFYSGSRARKDIKELAYQLKPGDTLDVFYLVICVNGFLFAKKEFKELAEECKIDIKFHPLAQIENERMEHREYKDGIETIWWMKNHMCMWPDCLSKSDPDIVRYLEQLQKCPGKCERYPFRGTHWINDEGVFSSSDRRALVEYAFLKKGIQIANSYSETKGMYPLGYNLWPSFGFGILFATDYNVPNNAPLVIWADKNWYPLLPRRINNQSDVLVIEDNLNYENNYLCEDYYNTCPDCGNIFGLYEDGGNGFCIDCALGH